LNSDEKLLKGLHTEIQKLIKDMRSGKKVLPDEALKVIESSPEVSVEE
jgi:hypothetical protein